MEEKPHIFYLLWETEPEIFSNLWPAAEVCDQVHWQCVYTDTPVSLALYSTVVPSRPQHPCSHIQPELQVLRVPFVVAGSRDLQGSPLFLVGHQSKDRWWKQARLAHFWEPSWKQPHQRIVSKNIKHALTGLSRHSCIAQMGLNMVLKWWGAASNGGVPSFIKGLKSALPNGLTRAHFKTS